MKPNDGLVMSGLITHSLITAVTKTTTSERCEDYSCAEAVQECDICGSNHDTKCCTFLPEKQTISDSKALSRARLTLPPNLQIENLGDGTTGVKTLAVFEKGTRFGPMEAKKTRSLNPSITFPLKLFGKTEKQTLYLDTSSEENCNWMCLVPGSIESPEAPETLNLMCYQTDSAIFYTTTRRVKLGEWLRVGYAPNYALRMGVKCPIIFQNKKDEVDAKKMKKDNEESIRKEIVEKLSAKDLGVPQGCDSSKWTCHLCKLEFSKVYVYATHLSEHYKTSMKLSHNRRKRKCSRTCNTCNTRFRNKELFSKHVCLVSQPCSDPVACEEMAINETVCSSSLSGPHETLEKLLQQYESEIDLEMSDENMYSINPNQMTNAKNMADRSSTPKQSIIDASLSDASFDSSHFLSIPKQLGLQEARSDVSSLNSPSQSTRVEQMKHGSELQLDKDADNCNFIDMNPHDSFNPEQFLNDELLLDKFKTPDGKMLDIEGGSLDISNISIFSLDQNQLLNTEENWSNAIAKHQDNVEDSSARSLESNLFDLDQSLQKQVSRMLTNMDGAMGEGLMQASCDKSTSKGAPMSQEDSNRVKENISQNQSLVVPTAASAVYSLADSFLTDIQIKPLESSVKSVDFTFVSESSVAMPVASKSVQCPICSKTFANKSNLLRHLRKHTGDFVCTACFAVFARKDNLYHHKCNLDPDRGRFECDSCGRKFTHKSFLQRHIASKHLCLWKCKACNVAYSSEDYLRVHECGATSKCDKTSPSEACFKCSFCGKSFAKLPYLTQHLKCHPTRQCRFCGKTLVNIEKHESYCSQAVNLDPDGLAKCPECEQVIFDLVTFRSHALQHTHPWICSACKLMFSTSKLLDEHICAESRCDVCKESFSTYSAFQTHSVSHGIPEFHCFECGFSYYTLEGFTTHDCLGLKEFRKKYRKPRTESNFVQLNAETPFSFTNSGSMPNLLLNAADVSEPEEEKEFVCDKCGRVFKLKSSLLFHIKQHDGEKFQCHICDVVFERKDVLKNHYSVHQKPQVPCPQCDHKFKTTKSLNIHMRSHMGVGFSCHLCDRKFTQKYHLKKHLEMHDPRLRRLAQRQCHVCRAWLGNKYYLKQHLLRHGDKEHRCPVGSCGKQFGTANLLKAHIKSIHLHGGFTCPYCSKTIRFKTSMKRHLLGKHREMKEKFEAPNFFEGLKSPPLDDEMQDLLQKIVTAEQGPISNEVVVGEVTEMAVDSDGRAEGVGKAVQGAPEDTHDVCIRENTCDLPATTPVKNANPVLDIVSMAMDSSGVQEMVVQQGDINMADAVLKPCSGPVNQDYIAGGGETSSVTIYNKAIKLQGGSNENHVGLQHDVIFQPEYAAEIDHDRDCIQAIQNKDRSIDESAKNNATITCQEKKNKELLSNQENVSALASETVDALSHAENDAYSVASERRVQSQPIIESRDVNISKLCDSDKDQNIDQLLNNSTGSVTMKCVDENGVEVDVLVTELIADSETIEYSSDMNIVFLNEDVSNFSGASEGKSDSVKDSVADTFSKQSSQIVVFDKQYTSEKIDSTSNNNINELVKESLSSEHGASEQNISLKIVNQPDEVSNSGVGAVIDENDKSLNDEQYSRIMNENGIEVNGISTEMAVNVGAENNNDLVWIEDGTIIHLNSTNEEGIISFFVIGSENETGTSGGDIT